MTRTTLTRYSEQGTNNPDMEERLTILEQIKFESEDPNAKMTEHELRQSTNDGVSYNNYN